MVLFGGNKNTKINKFVVFWKYRLYVKYINLHNIIQLQSGVWRWVYQDVGEGILMIIHFI